MPWSNNGTVQVSSGGTIATGTGTTFLSSARVGDAITIAGSTSLHEVTAIASDTQLTFQPPYTGTTGSGKAYRIAPIMGYDKDLSDAFNSIRLQWGTQLSSLQPWATAATADIALSNLGGSQTGTAVFKGSPDAGRTALELGNAATRTALGTTGALYSRDSILGRVSQSGGIPTGAIIERGSNANGSYVRFADGTQICTNKVTINRVTNPGGKQNNELAPAASFVGVPATYRSIEFLNGSNGAFPPLYSFGTTQSRFVNSGETGTNEFSWPPQIGTFTANSEVQTLIAIGRWY